MNSKKLKTVIACCLIFLGVGSSYTKADSQTEIANKVFADFFRTMGKPYASGLPDKALQQKLEPYFSKPMLSLIHVVANREKQCISINSRINTDIVKNTPKDQTPAILKPELIEGSIFTFQYETPASFKVLKSSFKNGNVVLVVQYINYDNNLHETYYWKNKVILINELGKWKIDNFIDIPIDAGNNKPEDVKSSLKDFPSCEKYYENYEKDNSH